MTFEFMTILVLLHLPVFNDFHALKWLRSYAASMPLVIHGVSELLE